MSYSEGCLKMAYGSLMEAAEIFRMTLLDIQRLETMRRERGLAPEPALGCKQGREVRKSAA
ncbi:hypothetical protein CSA37_03350 [Candidatus Fermentibacteria bacterium]|nr:MAG: hypothetical protein CSA37_03350 [Candidatus Fermentibacteria bacterium]